MSVPLYFGVQCVRRVPNIYTKFDTSNVIFLLQCICDYMFVFIAHKFCVKFLSRYLTATKGARKINVSTV